MVTFPDDPSYQGFFSPTRFAAEVLDCEVEGKVPVELDGAFYRVGGDWYYPPMHPDDSPFNADGYVSMFRFKSGNVDYRGQYAKTERFLANLKAKKQLYGYYRNASTDDPAVKGKRRDVANTNIFAHANKLWALKEDMPPLEIDPKTLNTRKYDDFGGKYKSPTFTAHPKIDPVTGEMICFGYEAKGDASNEIYVAFVNKAGKVTREMRFPAPYVSMVHDITISHKHILIPVYGMTTSKEWLAKGKVHWAWDSSLPSYLGIVPRDGEAKDVRWIKGPEAGVIHTLNGLSDGNKVIFDAPISDSNPFPFFPPKDGSPWKREKSSTFIRRWTIDLSKPDDAGWQEKIMFPGAPGSLGRIDDRYLSLPYKYSFMSYRDAARPFDEQHAGAMKGRVTNCIGRFDMTTSKMESYFVGPAHSMQEVQFIPRKKGSAEGDGWLVAAVSNYADMRSELVVVDAVEMEEVARVILPFRMANQIHGNWYGADQLPMG